MRFAFLLLLSPLFFALSTSIVLTAGYEEDDRLMQSISPTMYDVMLTDLNYNKIRNISSVDLGFEHNSPTTEEPVFPIKGIVAVSPTNGRTVGRVIIQYKKKIIQSFIVFDTSAPYVYLCDRTLKALGIDHADHANLVVHGNPTAVHRSTNHFREVNVLGASYFLENGLDLHVYYRKRKVEITEASKLTAIEREEL